MVSENWQVTISNGYWQFIHLQQAKALYSRHRSSIWYCWQKVSIYMLLLLEKTYLEGGSNYTWHWSMGEKWQLIKYSEHLFIRNKYSRELRREKVPFVLSVSRCKKYNKIDDKIKTTVYGNGFYPVKEWSQHKCKGRNLRIWIYSGSGNGKFITDDKHLNLDRKALYQTGNSIFTKQHPIRDIYSSIYELKGSPEGLECRTSINAIGCVVFIYKGAYCARYTAPLT